MVFQQLWNIKANPSVCSLLFRCCAYAVLTLFVVYMDYIISETAVLHFSVCTSLIFNYDYTLKTEHTNTWIARGVLCKMILLSFRKEEGESEKQKYVIRSTMHIFTGFTYTEFGLDKAFIFTHMAASSSSKKEIHPCQRATCIVLWYSWRLIQSIVYKATHRVPHLTQIKPNNWMKIQSARLHHDHVHSAYK